MSPVRYKPELKDVPNIDLFIALILKVVLPTWLFATLILLLKHHLVH